ncbi:MAG: hypothetical protein COB68_06720 [SAR202 cluster bacterium]|nr:MAG: hypothetical protein COB68_06720 [SAR202 cluster bacterium]
MIAGSVLIQIIHGPLDDGAGNKLFIPIFRLPLCVSYGHLPRDRPLALAHQVTFPQEWLCAALRTGPPSKPFSSAPVTASAGGGGWSA